MPKPCGRRWPRGQDDLQQADAIITDHPGVTLLMRFADCVPVFLVDPHKRAVGLAHAGWLGTVRRTVVHAVEAMARAFGSDAGDLRVGIGPSSVRITTLLGRKWSKPLARLSAPAPTRRCLR